MKTAFELYTREYHNMTMPDLMIEFAKMHVEAALKEAAKKAVLKQTKFIDRDSIFNAYPLSNIK